MTRKRHALLRRFVAVIQIAALLLLFGYGLASAWQARSDHESHAPAASRRCCTDHVCRCTGDPQAARHCCCGGSFQDDADDPDEDDDCASYRTEPCGDDPVSLVFIPDLTFLPAVFSLRISSAIPSGFQTRPVAAGPRRPAEPQVPPPRRPFA